MTECVIDVLTTFDVFCDLLLNRPTTTWNLFVLYDKKSRMWLMVTLCMRTFSNRSHVRANQNACVIQLII